MTMRTAVLFVAATLVASTSSNSMIAAAGGGSAKKPSKHMDPLIDRPLMKACGIIAVKVPASVLTAAGSDADFAGLYTLQYETFDRMPVYRQYTWLCNKWHLQ